MESSFVTARAHIAPQSARALQNSFSRLDLDRAQALAESIARTVTTLEDTIAVADGAFIAAMSAATRGVQQIAANHFAKALVAYALAAWQRSEVAADAEALNAHRSAQQQRVEAERVLLMLPERARLATRCLGSLPGADLLIAELAATTIAFAIGFEVASSVLVTVRLADFSVSLSDAFAVSRARGHAPQVAGFGPPRRATVDAARRVTVAGDRPTLSAREREVLAQIVGGLTTAQVAARLGVKTTTVATLVGRIFNKLGVNNRAAAVGVALRYGLCANYDDATALNT
jgi:DNA-binding CsgD family transcriptional regulator